jgi:hypothetical protein
MEVSLYPARVHGTGLLNRGASFFNHLPSSGAYLFFQVLYRKANNLYSSKYGYFSVWDDLTTPPDPTGAHDSSTAFMYAVNEASMNGGGIVLVPPGLYSIGYTIALPSNVQLVGTDPSSVTIIARPGLAWAAGKALTTAIVTNSANIPGATPGQQSGIAVRNITFNGNAANLTGLPTNNNQAIIEMVNVVDVTIDRCTIFNCQGNALTVDAPSGTTTPIPADLKIVNNTIDVMATGGGTPTGGLSIRVTGCANAIIRNNVIGYNPSSTTWTNQTWSQDGIEVLYGSQVTISGNQIKYVLDGIACNDGFDCVITDNIVENFLGYGIRTERALSTDVSGVSYFDIANNVVNAAAEKSGAAQSIAGIEASGGAPASGSGPPTATHFAVGNNVVTGPYSSAGIVCGASFGACSGNSIDMNANGLAQIGLLLQGSYTTASGNQVFDSSVISEGASPSGTGIEVSIAAGDNTSALTNVVIASCGVANAATGIMVGCDIKYASITNNNLASLTNPFVIGTSGGSPYTTTGSRVAGNLGWNPPLASLLSQPSNPTGTGGAFTNPFIYDCMVSVAIGTSGGTNGVLSSISVDGHAIAWPTGAGVSVAGPVVVQVPVNGSITVAGTAPLTWFWTAE